MSRKIDNAALIAALRESNECLDRSIKLNRWFLIEGVHLKCNWPVDLANKEIGYRADAIERAAKAIRDNEHAIAALESEGEYVKP